MPRLRSLIAALAVGAVAVAGCTSSDDSDDGAASSSSAPGATGSPGGPQGGDTLARVRANGVVRCGSREDLPGFATLDPSGRHVGFDVEFCRVIAAGVLGDANAVELRTVATADRFTALQSGEIDVLVRNTTWTAQRDGTEGARFLHPTFYDGQGMMVAADSGIDELADLSGRVVCAAGGTTTEGNVATEFARLGLEPPEVLPFDSPDLIQQAFQADRCDGWTSDRSQLIGLRSRYPQGPDALVILEGTFSKEPLAPAVRDVDVAWAQAVEWSVFATIQAEEFGLTSENVESERTSTTDPNVQRFLGVPVDGAVLDPGLGLAPDFAFQIVSQVGNYGEIYDRTIGEPLGLERGLNALWTDGGLHYAPPYR